MAPCRGYNNNVAGTKIWLCASPLEWCPHIIRWLPPLKRERGAKTLLHKKKRLWVQSKKQHTHRHKEKGRMMGPSLVVIGYFFLFCYGWVCAAVITARFEDDWIEVFVLFEVLVCSAIASIAHFHFYHETIYMTINYARFVCTSTVTGGGVYQILMRCVDRVQYIWEKFRLLSVSARLRAHAQWMCVCALTNTLQSMHAVNRRLL